MLAAARGAVSGLTRGKDKAEADISMADAKPAPRPGADVAPDLSLDQPLEPGSGRPRPGQRDRMSDIPHDAKA